MQFPFWGWLVALATFAPVLPACSAERLESGPASAPARNVYAFDYPALDGSRLSSQTTRGRRTLLVFLTTYDLASQVVVREMLDLVHTVTPKINAGAVVLEPPKNQPLVEAFVASLEITFPVAMADAATLEGRGPFGEIVAVPTILVLDAEGALVLRREGAASKSELREALGRAR